MNERIGAAAAAHILGVSRDTVIRRAAAGQIPVLSKGEGRTDPYWFDRDVIDHLADEAAQSHLEAGMESWRRRLRQHPGRMWDPDEDTRIWLDQFLISQGWEPTPESWHVLVRFVDSVHRRYVMARGHPPAWDRGYVYRGYTDFLIIRDTYNDEIAETR